MLKVSQCLNPDCLHKNPPQITICEQCGSKLLLGERYRAERYIGKGSFGRTFLAVDQHRLDTPCVIKQFLPSATGETGLHKAVQLFKQEAIRLRDLGKHPQIPDLEAFFEQEQRLYLIQEFIDGQDLLKEVHQKGRLSEAEVKQILVELLPVLQFIHEHQVIHRDIKPSNIIRRLDGSLVLIDFGVAKQQLEENAAPQDATITGTLGYAAPEQLLGKVVPASDLYALGATCVRLLTGCLPKANESELLYDPIEMEWKWQEMVVVNPLLARIFNKLLDYRVSNRYQSANEVIEALKTPVIPVINTPSVRPIVDTPPQSTQPTSYSSGYGQVPSAQRNYIRRREQLPFEPVSECGLDYSKLSQFLQDKKFQDADKETFRLMLLACARNEDGWLRDQDIERFPCSDLSTIDQLWRFYSSNKFGFSVQKNIYEKLKLTETNSKRLTIAFCDKVGWRVDGKWVLYEKLDFSRTATFNAPSGQLPCGGPMDLSGGMMFSDVGSSFVFSKLISSICSRLHACNIG